MAFPTFDTALVPYSQNWHERLTEDATPYGLTAAQAAAFTAAYEPYIAAVNALQVARAAGIRSRTLASNRNDARLALLRVGRELYAYVQANPSVTDGAKHELGVVVPDREPTAVEPLTEQPVLSVASVVNRTVKLLVRGTGTGRARPSGAIGALVFASVSESAPSEIDQWKLVSTIGHTQVSIPFPGELPPGTRVHFTAMWINNRKESGPLATPVSAYLGGGVAKAE